jgi:AcrR family transcriptional regulator
LQLTRDDWIHAGLRLLATSGVESVKVEALTKELHISKGSFYHYWQTRSEFLEALIACWEERGTRRVIDELEKLRTPQERFQRLFETSFSADKKLETAIHHWANVDESVARRVAATEEVRVAYITKLLCDMGKPFTQASSLARLCYLVYLGWMDWIGRNDPTAGQLPEIQQTLWALVFAHEPSR